MRSSKLIALGRALHGEKDGEARQEAWGWSPDSHMGIREGCWGAEGGEPCLEKGQCPEPTCCFQSQFYSLPCAIQTQCLHLKMGTIIPVPSTPAPWELGGLKDEAGELQHPGGISYCSRVATLTWFTQRFPKVIPSLQEGAKAEESASPEMCLYSTL